MEGRIALLIESAKRKFHLGAVEQAIELLEWAVGISEEPQVQLLLGQLLLEMARPEDALGPLERATNSELTSTAAAPALALALSSMGQNEAGYALLLPLVEQEPAPFEALLNFSHVCFHLDRGEEGAVAARRALKLQPNSSTAAINTFLCARTLDVSGTWRELVEVAMGQPGTAALRVAAAESLYFDDLHESEVIALHREVGDRLGKTYSPTRRFAGTRDPKRTLKIGFLSPDFRCHPVASFTLSFLRYLKELGFELSFYSLNLREDSITERYKELGDFHPCARLRETAIAQKCLSDSIDVLFDLAGYTVGGRPELLAIHPAPLVFSGIGYPASLQIEGLTGELADQDGHADWPRPLIQKPLLCYEPTVDAPAIEAASSGAFTWGAYCNAKKINRQTAMLWSEVLRATPGSRLRCMSAQFSKASERTLVGRYFDEVGIGNAELVEGPVDYAGYMSEFNAVDGILDTYPFNGATTTLDALIMGVPVVTLKGTSHRSRVGASLLEGLGHLEWSANDSDDVIERAQQIFTAGKRPSSHRVALRSQVHSSLLMDGRQYARCFGLAVRSHWEQYCNP